MSTTFVYSIEHVSDTFKWYTQLRGYSAANCQEIRTGTDPAWDGTRNDIALFRDRLNEVHIREVCLTGDPVLNATQKHNWREQAVGVMMNEYRGACNYYQATPDQIDENAASATATNLMEEVYTDNSEPGVA